MNLRELTLSRFRCHESLTLSFGPGVNVICGENGVGKTSVLEAVGYLSTTRSFRHAKDREIIAFGARQAHVRASVEMTRDGQPEVRELEAFLGEKRELRLDGGSLTPRQMLGLLPSVLFSPEDLELVKGVPSERRRFLDLTLGQMRPRYVAELSQYRRVLQDKRRVLFLLAEKPSFAELLPEYNRHLARLGAYITGERKTVADRLESSAAQHHAAISGSRETLSLRLLTHAASEEEALESMQRRELAERAQRQCLIGSHRDDLELLLNGHPLRDYGSQGQLRTAALALKLAQRDILREDTGQWPVLLLDDVLSELDAGRRGYILRHTGRDQVLLTGCDRPEDLQADRLILL